MRRAPLVAAAAIVTVVALAGLRLANDPGPDNDAEPRGGAPVTTLLAEEAPGPARITGGVPQGWSRDAVGARAAALSAVSLTGEVARAGFITRDDMIRSLASRRFGPTLAAESAGQLQEMTGELGAVGVTAGSVTFRELPLTARVVRADTRSAVVEVWSVLVVGVPDVGAPRQAWRTVTVELVWEDGDWRIDGWTARDGPTPAMDAHLSVASVAQVAEVAAWPSTIGGG